MFDAVRLVRLEGIVIKTKPSHVAAARHWIEAGNVGAVTFDACCAWLAWDAEHAREAISSTASVTAEQYAWPEIIERALLPQVSFLDLVNAEYGIRPMMGASGVCLQRRCDPFRTQEIANATIA